MSRAHLLPWAELILQASRYYTYTSQLILQPFRRFTYITTHSPTLPLLHLRHSSFYNPSFASLTSQALHLCHLASRQCNTGNYLSIATLQRLCTSVYEVQEELTRQQFVLVHTIHTHMISHHAISLFFPSQVKSSLRRGRCLWPVCHLDCACSPFPANSFVFFV